MRQITPAIERPDTVLRVHSVAVQGYLEAALSKNTRRAYRSDLKHFTDWGGTIPAGDFMIAEYLAAHAGTLAIQGDVRAAALLAKLILQLLPEEGAVGLSEGLGDDDLEILENYEKRLRRFKPRPKKRMKSPRKVTGARDKHSAKKRKKEKNR